MNLEAVNNILVCPNSNQKLIIDHSNFCLKTEDNRHRYPIQDGILDFVTEPKQDTLNQKVAAAYDSSADKYDTLITSANFSSKFMIKLTWGLQHEDYVDRIIDYIPDDFKGTILDLPVGTGVYTCEKYQRLKQATIIAVDFSFGMLKQAKKRFEKHQINNVIFVRADACSLPIINQSVDYVLSLNGIHAFVDKEKAITEKSRVLKIDGNYSGCSFVKGKRKISDICVNHFLTSKGFFSKPFYSSEALSNLLNKHFCITELDHMKSFMIFNMKKSPVAQQGI